MADAYKEAYEFTQRAELYAQEVALHLASSMGESAAASRVLERLAIVLMSMIEGGRADDMARRLNYLKADLVNTIQAIMKAHHIVYEPPPSPDKPPAPIDPQS